MLFFLTMMESIVVYCIVLNELLKDLCFISPEGPKAQANKTYDL